MLKSQNIDQNQIKIVTVFNIVNGVGIIIINHTFNSFKYEQIFLGEKKIIKIHIYVCVQVGK